MVTKCNYREVAQAIVNRVSQMICLTEDCTPAEFLIIKEEINHALNTILPDKSGFEI